jgi:hypothetical protein
MPVAEMFSGLETVPDWTATAVSPELCIIWLEARTAAGPAVTVRAACAAVFSVRFAEAEWVDIRLAATFAVLSAPEVWRMFANKDEPICTLYKGVAVPVSTVAARAAAKDCPRETVPEVVAVAAVVAATFAVLSAPPKPAAVAVWAAEVKTVLITSAEGVAVAVVAALAVTGEASTKAADDPH